jgi:glycosyltransferase involved in cell wall biosynthesis
MRILFVAMSGSIHTHRWISQVADGVRDIHLFPSVEAGYLHPGIENVIVHNNVFLGQKGTFSSRRFRDVSPHCYPFLLAAKIFWRLLWAVSRFVPRDRRLAGLIRRIRPDVVHSLEIQHAGYLVLGAKRRGKGGFPPWIVTNWGSDIYLFGRLSEHEPKIREVLAECDYYSCECHRDVGLAREYGLKGKELPVFPNTGGFDLEGLSRLRAPGPSSARRLIVLKGYQHWAGRALVGLRALERCANLLTGYEVAIFSATHDVVIAAELFSKSTSVPVRIVPLDSPQEEILRLHGHARVSIGLSISDAISTALLEAMVMGSFPIQSCTSCAEEWVEDGRTGIIVPPEDPEVVELAIRRALTDDPLVDRAAEENAGVAAERLGRRHLKSRTLSLYDQVLGGSKT